MGYPRVAPVILICLFLIAGCGGNTSTSGTITATPTFSPGAGTYTTAQTVTISDTTAGAVLYCTTDGTAPTTSSPKCAQPTTVYQTEFLQAIAMAPGKSASAAASAGYVINPNALPTPIFSPAGGTYTGAQQVTISDTLNGAGTGANIYYTLDGTTPTVKSTLYTGPVTIAQSEILSAIAIATGYANSGVASAAYTIQPATGTGLTITSISPNSVQPGSAGFNLTVYGTNFVQGSTVLWSSTASSSADAIAPQSISIHAQNFASPAAAQSNGTPLTTTFVSSTELQAAVPADLVATSASIAVSVANPDGTTSGSGPSSPTFGVGAPAIASLSPSSVIAGSGGFALTVNGTNFALGSTVQWGTTALVTTSVSSTQLMAAVPASLVATAGSAAITVTDSAGTSSAMTFIVATALPTITALSPSSATAGAGGFTLAVAGANFDSSARVNWNGSALTTTFVSAAQVTAAVPASLIASAGTASITVSTAAGASGASAFTIQSGTPTITGLNPTSATAGGPAFTLTVNGTNFDSSAKINWNGAPQPTTPVNATTLTANIPASLIASSGTASITVTTTAGASSASSFTIQAAPPTVTGTNPTSATVGGQAFTLTVNGTNFDSSAKINWNGAALTTAYVNATTVTANIPANLITSVGTVNISVTTSGGTSAVSAFAIQLGAPTIATISPTSVTVGGPAFTLTVNGTNFDSSAAVKWNGAALGTTLVSATQLKAAVPASLITSTGTASITVTTSVGASPVASSVAIQQAGVPTIGTLDPSSVTAGGSAFLLTVNGGGFDSSSVIKWNGTALTTIYVSNTELQAAISADMVASASTVSVTVSGTVGESAPSSFIIKLGVPIISGFDPTSASSNDPNFTTLTVNGTNFDSSAVVKWNDTALTTTYVNAGQVKAAVPASLSASPGTASITVTTTAGASAASNFTVNLGKPTISNIDPTSVTAGGISFTLKVTGTNFDSSAKINWNATPLTTTPVSATEVDANIDATLIAAAGSAAITVTNSAGPSNSFTLPINAASPTVTGVSPATGSTAGGTTVTITGTNLTGATAVNFGSVGATNFTVNSDASITVVSPAGAVGTVHVTVTTPNGGTSTTSSADQFTYAVMITGFVKSGNGTGTTAAIPLGATVQLWAAGTTAYGPVAAPGATSLGSAQTDASTGAFLLPYDCSNAQAPGDQLYIVATGTSNSEAVLMTVVGSCSAPLASSVTINEATTVASAYALQQFMAADGSIGAKIADTTSLSYTGLSYAFKTVNNLVDLSLGTVRDHTPGYSKFSDDPYIVNNSTVPQARINTLANALNACASNGNGCGDLKSAATVGSNTPANTLQAILNIAQNPGNNVGLYAVASSSTAYSPSLADSSYAGNPIDWTLALTFTGGGLGLPPGFSGTAPTNIGGLGGPVINTGLGIDGSGNIWITAVDTTGAPVGGIKSSLEATGSSMLVEFNNLGAPATTATSTTGGTSPTVTYGGYRIPWTSGVGGVLTNPNALAIDPTGNVWVVGLASSPGLAQISPQLSVLQGPIGTNGALNMAIDGTSNVWLAAPSSLTEYNSSGTQQFTVGQGGGTGIGNPYGLTSPSSIAFDSNNQLWIEDNAGYGDLDLFDPTNGVVFDPFFSDGNPLGQYSALVADGSGNIYSCSDLTGHMDVSRSSGGGSESAALALSTGRGCGGKMVIDGAGHIFVISGATTPGIIDVYQTTGGTSPTITQVSPDSGYTGTGTGEPMTINPDPTYEVQIQNSSFGFDPGPGIKDAAIDGSGNLWVLNPDTGASTSSAKSNVLVEYVGLAAPVVTPASSSLKNNQIGVRP